MDTEQFETFIESYIRSYNLLPPGGRAVVALSGGADSVALLAVLCSLKYQVVAAHCDFHLRGDESERDRAFAQKTAELFGCEFHEVHFDVAEYQRRNGVSVEMACRDLRYRWFGELASKLSETKPLPVAVAHHFDDNVETVLLNLLRGTGVSGLRGMLPVTERGIIRPFLQVTRRQILEYLNEKNIGYVTDSSNLENDVLRNRLRNIVLPEIYRLFPEARKGLSATIGNMGRTESLLADFVGICQKNLCTTEADGNVHIDLRELKAISTEPTSLLFEMIRRYGFNFAQCRDIIATSESGRSFLADEYVAVTSGRYIIIGIAVDSQVRYEVNDILHDKLPEGFYAKEVDLADVKFARGAKAVYLSPSAIGKTFVFRRWQPADRMKPFGMKGSRLLSDIFSDAHLSMLQKRSIWVVECGGEIVWVPALRTSAHYTLLPNDKYALCLCFKT
ncbi:MAG: tRNA lysidine(34) synthetase TilS [Muribaculum sp.]|nr:tRNA lysidine(34) synthetase TilS [Muribaculaceae bacterium]MCM1081292.1 tRNA lysidine(34) synthetase TilS [Muribaculum sp.]